MSDFADRMDHSNSIQSIDHLVCLWYSHICAERGR